MEIEKIDPNFKAPGIGEFAIEYQNVLDETPIAIEGLPWRKEHEDHPFYRIPASFTAENTNSGVIALGDHTSGGALRFRSDSPVIVLRGKLWHSLDMSHMPRAGSAGFDSYRALEGEELIYNKTIQPAPGQVDFNNLIGVNPDKVMCDWLINFPRYGGVDALEVGIVPGSTLLPPKPHKISKPILFYGSSITQGGCTSRPGNAYSSFLCRKVDAEEINLGFSGCGRGEKAVAEAIAATPMSAFIYDYDHNAPSVEHLAATHEPFFKIIREAQPDLPIIILSKCDFKDIESDRARRRVIEETWNNARKSGDEKVWFIDGELLFGRKCRDACTVDGCHPNDLGFYRMYKHVLPVLKTALRNSGKKGKKR